MLERHVPDGRVLDLLWQYVRRTIYDGGLYENVERGISLGCPLSRRAQRVSQHYEQGVDLLHIGTYLRRWLRWARCGLRALGAGLSEPALVLVLRSLVRLGWLGGGLPRLLPAAVTTVGEEGDGTERRYD